MAVMTEQDVRFYKAFYITVLLVMLGIILYFRYIKGD